MDTGAVKNAIGKTTAFKRNKYIEWIYGYSFIAPLLIGVLVFFIGPILFTFYISLTDWTSLEPGSFVGFENYIQAFKDKRLTRELTNTAVYTLGTVPTTLVLSLWIANALNKIVRGRSALTTIYFLPNVTMPTAVAMVWAWLLNSKYGIVNYLLGLVGLPGPVWIGDPRFIMPSIIIVSIWMGLGYNIIILTAGLKNIPVSYYEACDMDGASEWAKFTRITLPLLSPHIFFLLVVSVIGAFKAFDVIFMLTVNQLTYGNLVEASRTMVYGIYEKAFSLYKMGYASTEAVFLFIIIAVVTAVQFTIQKRWVHYD
ncbi:MAG: carbohydrate ABC transporter permease [Bacillota bacterium]